MKFSTAAITALASTAAILTTTTDAMCPYMDANHKTGSIRAPSDHPNAAGRYLNGQQQQQQVLTPPLESTEIIGESRPRTGDHGVPQGGFAAVQKAIRDQVLTNSQDFWPADFGNYGPFFIRLAWHCSGSFRNYDGRGGCDGGRIRFDPELNWEDNANLDKALQLLQPIKDQFGSSLSWGDLIILAGTTAIESMGGPTIGFCGGRVDDADGSASLIQSPSSENCINGAMTSNGQCVIGVPIAPSHAGLIYVNPAGPEQYGPGEDGKPLVDPAASGPDIRQVFAKMGFDDRRSVALIGGGHAFGKAHAYTSGFEGTWTSQPTTWTNQFFNNLFDNEWTVIEGPGGEPQWAHADNTDRGFMFTSDLALRYDEDYNPIAQEYADNLASLENDFAEAWYQLTTGDMGPATRCIGDLLPTEPQEFQHALPDLEGPKPDYIPIRQAIQELIDDDSTNIGAFSKLAKDCANTFRATDYRGGCNGGRIRYEPEASWSTNEGDDVALQTLEQVKQQFPEVSYSDLIVLAGQTALEQAGASPMTFCGGRVDAEDGSGSENLEPRVYFPASLTVQDDMVVKGLTLEEGVALFATPTDSNSTTLSNQYFVDLKSGNGDFNANELSLLQAPFLDVVNEFIASDEAFLEAFESGWTYMMTADRYDGPVDSVCDGVDDATLEETTFVN